MIKEAISSSIRNFRAFFLVIILFLTFLFSCLSVFAGEPEKRSSMEIGRPNWQDGDEWIVNCGNDNIFHFKVIGKEIAESADKRVNGENCWKVKVKRSDTNEYELYFRDKDYNLLFLKTNNSYKYFGTDLYPLLSDEDDSRYFRYPQFPLTIGEKVYNKDGLRQSVEQTEVIVDDKVVPALKVVISGYWDSSSREIVQYWVEGLPWWIMLGEKYYMENGGQFWRLRSVNNKGDYTQIPATVDILKDDKSRYLIANDGNFIKIFAIGNGLSEPKWTFKQNICETYDFEDFDSGYLSQGKIVFTTEWGMIYTIDKTTGKLLWESGEGNYLPRLFFVEDKVLVLQSGPETNETHSLLALDLTSGNKLWSFDFWDSASLPTIINDKIYIVANDDEPKFCTIDLNTGKVAQEISLGEGSPYGEAPNIKDNKAFIKVREEEATIDLVKGELIRNLKPSLELDKYKKTIQIEPNTRKYLALTTEDTIDYIDDERKKIIYENVIDRRPVVNINMKGSKIEIAYKDGEVRDVPIKQFLEGMTTRGH